MVEVAADRLSTLEGPEFDHITGLEEVHTEDFLEELEKCREWLAGQLGTEDVPDDVWGYLNKLSLPHEAIKNRYDRFSSKELIQEAKAYGTDVNGQTQSTPPDRSGKEAGPSEIALETSANAARRAQAFAEVAVTLADEHPRVKSFRRRLPRRYSGGRRRLLTDSEARVFFDKQSGPDDPGIWLKELRKLAGRLSKTYCWREGDAMWFVLTGHTPPVMPLGVRVLINVAPKHAGTPMTLVPGSDPPRYVAEVPKPTEYHPNTARITVTADAWVDVKEVNRAFRDVQNQILAGADAAGPMPERILEVIKFVSRRKRSHGEESWDKLRREWNRTYPEGWSYKNQATFQQVFERFAENVVYRTYHLPTYKPPDPTPYQAYQIDLARQNTGEAGGD